jgi:tripartite-type tricarboxylate transporter receptor subunit TctC
MDFTSSFFLPPFALSLWAGCVLCTSAVVTPAAEPGPADYPARPIRIIVPQSPGGTTDFTARALAPRLSERTGQPVVVDNRAGAGSMVGTDLVAKAAPDGYTLLVAASALTIIPSMYRNVPFDPVRDFAPISTISWYPNIVVLHPSVPASSIKELIALARAKPGTINYASGGNGTGPQLQALLFAAMTGIRLTHVPYKGGGPAIIALLGGEVQLYFAPMPSIVPHVKAGRLRALAITSRKRSPAMPDLPSVAEAGLKGYDESTWNGLFAPARAPPAVVARLNAEVLAILKTREMHERLASQGAEPAGTSPGELAAIVKREVVKWAKVIREAGIQPE